MTPQAKSITPHMLLAGRPIAQGASPAPPVDMLAVSLEMREFVDYYAGSGGKAFRLTELAQAVMGQGTFGLTYDNETRTAAETFRQRSGNCLSFTAMFVVMARYAGLEASFQEVEVPPDWISEGGTLVLRRHINALVDLSPNSQRIVDFNVENFRSGYDSRVVDDTRALAHFYNNIGVDRLQVGNTGVALQYFRKAIESDGSFSPAWSNLGTLYSRNSQAAYAEAAYLQALTVDRGDSVAMSNLASLYEARGLREQADWYRAKVKSHRDRNPYYHHQLAEQAFDAGDFETATKHLQTAIRRKANDHRFHGLLGRIYLQLGDHEGAQRSFQEAEALASTRDLKNEYSQELDLLTAADLANAED